MKIKKQYFNLQYGNKGFIFTLDIAIATSIVIILMVVSNYYIIKSNQVSVTKLEITRVGNDITAILDYNGILNSENETLIYEKINTLIPNNYDMHLRLIIDSSKIVETTNTIPLDRFVGSGERVLIINNKNSIARFWIWLK